MIRSAVHAALPVFATAALTLGCATLERPGDLAGAEALEVGAHPVARQLRAHRDQRVEQEGGVVDIALPLSVRAATVFVQLTLEKLDDARSSFSQQARR